MIASAALTSSPRSVPGTGHAPLIGMFDRELQAPISVLIELTRRCNLKCLHCFSNSGAQVRTTELAASEWTRFIDRLAEMGVFLIFFGGGEPLSRRDCFAIASHARRRGIELCLLSNLTPITKEKARRLKEIGFYKIEGNLDGPDAATYEALRNTPGSFAKTIQGIRNCVAAGLPLRINCTLTRLNQDHIERIAQLAASLGVTDVAFIRLIEAGRGGVNFRALDFGEQHYRRALLPRLIELRHKYAGVMNVGYEQDEELIHFSDPNKQLPWCGSGRIHCTVTPDGRVKPDHSFPDDDPDIIAGNILHQDFADIWRNAEVFKTIRHTAFSECLGCEHVGCAGGDVYKIYSHYGSLMKGRDPRCVKLESGHG